MKLTEVSSHVDKTSTYAVSDLGNKKCKVEKDDTADPAVEVTVNYKAVCRKGPWIF